jgi:hypothetical protein
MEFEFEMQDVGEYEASSELELESAAEAAGEESEYEADYELELEMDDEMEYEGQEEEDPSVNRLAERLYEFATTSFESEYEADERLASILNEAERDFFFKKLFKKGKGLLKGVVKKGLGKLVKRIPFGSQLLKVGSSLVRGDFKGALGSLVKSGLLKSALSMIPGAGPVIASLEPALKAAGVQFEVADTDEGKRQLASDVAYVTREAYDYLANTIADPNKQINLLNPIQSNKLANKALVYGLKKAKMAGRPSFGGTGEGLQNGQKRRVKKIYIKKGQVAKIIAV